MEMVESSLLEALKIHLDTALHNLIQGLIFNRRLDKVISKGLFQCKFFCDVCNMEYMISLDLCFLFPCNQIRTKEKLLLKKKKKLSEAEISGTKSITNQRV